MSEAAPHPPPPPPPTSDGRATAAMVIGIIALVLAVVFFPLGLLLGVVAVVLGLVARRRPSSDRTRATVGIVTGAIAVVIAGLITAYVVDFFSDNADEIDELTQCLDEAQGDAEERACQRRFEERLDE